MGSRLRALLRRILPETLRRRIASWLRHEARIADLERRLAAALREAYRPSFPELVAPPFGDGRPLGRFEQRLFSQNGEDGILLHLFRTVGVTDRRFVEFGIGCDLECNSAALAVVFGWQGLFMDCNPYTVNFARHRMETVAPGHGCRFRHRRIEPETLDAVLAEEGFEGSFDLLSIDIDSNDFHVWKALTVARPRIVVIEYNATFGPEREVTIPYTPGFDRWAHHPRGWYFGASLALLARLGREKGYRLAGTDRSGVNAFFVREDAAGDVVPAETPKEAFHSNRGRDRVMPLDAQFASLAHLPLLRPYEAGGGAPSS